MPSVEENLERWQHHEWTLSGDEWSPGGCAEGTPVLWHRTLLPRIYRFVPAHTILEIGPGFGRWTQFLRQFCDRLILVDLSARCIESCATRFAGDPNIEYHVNDGASLEMVPDRSVDFIFSFDSLVHAEADAIGAYLQQAARKLKPEGAGFVHHSNLSAFVNPRTGELRRFVTQPNWRAASVSAATFRAQCEAAGLSCESQELINWIGKRRDADRHRLSGRMVPLTDCLSVFTARERGGPTRVLVNHRFVEEWRQSVAITDTYLKDVVSSRTAGGPAKPSSKTVTRKFGTVRAVLRRDGLSGVLTVAGGKIGAALEQAASATRAYALGLANAWFAARTGSTGRSTRA